MIGIAIPMRNQMMHLTNFQAWDWAEADWVRHPTMEIGQMLRLGLMIIYI